MQWFLVSSQSYATIASNYRTFSSSPKPINMCAYALSCFSHAQLFVTLWTVALWAPLSMRFSRQEYWSGLPCLPPGECPNSQIKPMSLTSPALADMLFTSMATWEACMFYIVHNINT